MEEVLKRFTLVDFIGIFVPGAVMAMALNFYGIDLIGPFESFFGQNTVVLSLYFLVLGYLVGSVLHQLGTFLEYFCKTNLWHEDYHRSPEIQETYRRCFFSEIPADPQKAWAHILRYVQRNGRPERVILFNSFYTMSRTMSVTLGCILPMVLYHHRDALCLWQTRLWLLTYVVVIGLFMWRWRRFEKKFVEEVYLLFSLQKLGTDRPAEMDREVKPVIELDENV